LDDETSGRCLNVYLKEYFMQSYTLSLSRWHKVAERLARNYTELTQAVRNTLTNTQVSGFLGEAQVGRLHQLASHQVANLDKAFEVQDALAKIRQAIGDANVRVGVSKDLAEYDALSRRQKLLETILAAQTSEMVGFDDLPQLPKQIVTEDRYDRSKGTVRVCMLNGDALAKLKGDAESLRARVYGLADRISDLNRERLTIDLTEEIAQVAGL
jgi:hypothetical protein